ncbi:hypothetical protein D3C71_1145630 [compost metagenome]
MDGAREVIALHLHVGVVLAQPRRYVAWVQRVGHAVALQRPLWPATHQVDVAQRGLRAGVAWPDLDHLLQIALRGGQVAAVGTHHGQVEVRFVARPVRIRRLGTVGPAPGRLIGLPLLQQGDRGVGLLVLQIRIGQFRTRLRQRRVSLECGFQHRDRLGRMLRGHQRIADGGQQIVRHRVALGEQRAVLVAHLCMAAQPIEQDQAVIADPQRRLLHGGAIAFEVLLHLHQRGIGFIQAGVFAGAIGQAPADQFGQVVAFQPFFLCRIEQGGARQVQLPGAVRVADVGQGQHLQAIQQCVVG